MNRAPTRRGELHHSIKTNYIMMKSKIFTLLVFSFLSVIIASGQNTAKKIIRLVHGSLKLHMHRKDILQGLLK